MIIWNKLKNKLISRWSNKVPIHAYLKECDINSAHYFLEILNIIIVNKNTYKIIIHFDDNGHSTAFLKHIFGGLVRYHSLNLCNKMLEFDTVIKNDIRVQEIQMIMKEMHKSLTYSN